MWIVSYVLLSISISPGLDRTGLEKLLEAANFYVDFITKHWAYPRIQMILIFFWVEKLIQSIATVSQSLYEQLGYTFPNILQYCDVLSFSPNMLPGCAVRLNQQPLGAPKPPASSNSFWAWTNSSAGQPMHVPFEMSTDNEWKWCIRWTPPSYKLAYNPINVITINHCTLWSLNVAMENHNC